MTKDDIRGTAHDYRVGDFRYDARVVDVGGSTLSSAQAGWAAFLFDDPALERQVAEDKAALDAICVAREEQVHRRVVWAQVAGRAVCTCGLVLQVPGRLHAGSGHRGRRWEPVSAYVAQEGDGPFVASCRQCGGAAEKTDLAQAHAWCASHTCPPAATTHTEGPASMDANHPTETGESALERRIARDDDLIPWEVKPEHRANYNLAMLRVESRRRAGLEVRETDRRRLDSWLGHVAEVNAVVLYDPDTPDGFYLVPREASDDDLIRRPGDPRLRTKRRRGD